MMRQCRQMLQRWTRPNIMHLWRHHLMLENMVERDHLHHILLQEMIDPEVEIGQAIEEDQGRERRNEMDSARMNIEAELDRQEGKERTAVVAETEMLARRTSQVTVLYSQTNINLVSKMLPPEMFQGRTQLE